MKYKRTDVLSSTIEHHGGHSESKHIGVERFILSTTGLLFIIEGSVGGSHYVYEGAAVNYLCLPNKPESLSRTGGSAYLYGGEYGNTEFGLQDGDDVPCAVCRTTANSVVMIPVLVNCYSGWTRQYYHCVPRAPVREV